MESTETGRDFIKQHPEIDVDPLEVLIPTLYIQGEINPIYLQPSSDPDFEYLRGVLLEKEGVS